MIDRVALVTGGNRGIGRVVEQLAAADTMIAVPSRSADAVEQAASTAGDGGGAASSRASDVSDVSDVSDGARVSAAIAHTDREGISW